MGSLIDEDSRVMLEKVRVFLRINNSKNKIVTLSQFINKWEMTCVEYANRGNITWQQRVKKIKISNPKDLKKYIKGITEKGYIEIGFT